MLDYVHKVRGIDFSLYRPATIKKKLDCRLKETGNTDLEGYLEYLKSHPEEMQNLVASLTIKVSNFFRNPLVFELLASNVLPELIHGFRFIKAWSIGCARGEEPYSLAILLTELQKKENHPVTVRIFGSDIDPRAIESAIKGEYPDNELEEVKKKYLDAFFERIRKPHDGLTECEQIFGIKEGIKEMVSLECADVLGQSIAKPGTHNHYNLILCRNMLIYLNRQQQEEFLMHLTGMLYENGFLIIGASETLPESVRQLFVQPFPEVKIYQKRFRSPGNRA